MDLYAYIFRYTFGFFFAYAVRCSWSAPSGVLSEETVNWTFQGLPSGNLFVWGTPTPASLRRASCVFIYARFYSVYSVHMCFLGRLRSGCGLFSPGVPSAWLYILLLFSQLGEVT